MTERAGAITKLRRIAMVVGNLDAAEAFFADAFSFEFVERKAEDAGLATLLGVPDTRIRQTVMRLGAQEIGLLAFDPPGRAYPLDSTSTDLWFQHFAIIVSDMDAAYRRLQAAGRFSAISDGPQVLPPVSGSVAAYKFRDSEGHPLELLAFPAGTGPAYWQEKASGALFLGIDHSAVSVSDTERSIAFYRDVLGLTLGEQTENIGPEQARMDGVPNAAVTVTGLNPVHAPSHVELLGYKVGARRPVAFDTRADDIAASMFVMETEALTSLVDRLIAAKARFISPGIVTLTDGVQAIAILDPDGHRVMVVQ
ncbi:VOC family protein [Beijerinckia sp. L45]|uniref:VOC family protein n=1 Tax=Beijerinckia sp. L45 TaxID=1641855 RepID=UPI00131A6274|nr:VOC family protein [Beijerinckia sp. L45]